jgi:predicted HicB family RNase H-like nuclease
MVEMAKRTTPRVTQRTPIGRDVDLKRQVRRDREGQRIDDAYVERLIGVSRKPGRPSLAEAGPSPSIAFRVPVSVREQAEAVAAKEGKTVSQLAREALEARIAAS